MTRSEELFDRARRSIPGGVDSPVRAFGAVGGTPPFIASGSGAYVTDVDGFRYVDWVQSWGANLFGHACPEIVDAAVSAARRGTSFGPQPRARSGWPSGSWMRSPRSTWSGWSRAGPRPR